MKTRLDEVLLRLNVKEPAAVAIGTTWRAGGGDTLIVRSPIDASQLASFSTATPDDVARVVEAAAQAFPRWRIVPAPLRGEAVRRIGQELREHK